MKKRASLIILLLASICYSTIFVTIKYMTSKGENPFALAFSTGVILTIIIIFLAFFNKQSLSQIKKVKLKSAIPWIVASVLVAGISPILTYSGQKLTSVANASFLFYLSPVFAGILGTFFFKEKLKKFFWLSLIMILVGTFFLTTNGGITCPNTGDLLILTVAFSFGFYAVAAKKYSTDVSAQAMTNFRLIIGNTLCFVIGFIVLGKSVILPLVHFPLLIVLNSVFIYFYLTATHIGIKNIGSSTTQSLLTVTALFSTLSAFIFLGEKILILQFIGGLAILGGVVLLIKRGV